MDTEATQSPDGAAQQSETAASKADMDQAIARRQAALDRAREAEAKLDKLQADLAARQQSEKEEQGKWQELANEHKGLADELAGKLQTAQTQLAGLQDKHRGMLMQRLEALPETVRETLATDLGETPALDQLERSLKLAEALSNQSQSSTGKPARKVNGKPAASTGALRQGDKLDAVALSKLTREERANYLREQYGLAR